MIRPGEVYMADFAEAGPHPEIVLSREALNRGEVVEEIVRQWLRQFNQLPVA